MSILQHEQHRRLLGEIEQMIDQGGDGRDFALRRCQLERRITFTKRKRQQVGDQWGNRCARTTNLAQQRIELVELDA